MAGMSLIVKTITRLVTTFITLFGLYVVVYGHVTPGGGFAGGVIIAAGLILVLLAFGREEMALLVSPNAWVKWACGGALAFLAIALLGYLTGSFFMNFLHAAHPHEMTKAGTIPLLEVAVAAIVGGGLFGVFQALAGFRPASRKGDQP